MIADRERLRVLTAVTSLQGVPNGSERRFASMGPRLLHVFAARQSLSTRVHSSHSHNVLGSRREFSPFVNQLDKMVYGLTIYMD